MSTTELRVLGDYHIVKRIGQGPLGTVYLAEHRFMKRPFVLKLLPEEMVADRSFVQRFEEEVALLATLDHPNIVKIHNISFAQGNYFLVTDCVVDAYAETTNLAQYLAAHGGRLEEEELYNMLLHIAEALDYAHAKRTKSIVHRGLKLNNVLVGKETVYLSDYGLTRIVGASAVLTRTYKAVAESLGVPAVLDRYPTGPVESGKFTALHSSFLQTYAFLAPEQKRPEQSVGPQADRYAFGVLTYYLLTGEFPEGLFVMPRTLRPDLEGDWDDVIQNCLQVDPLRRPELLVPLIERVRQPVLAPSAAYVMGAAEVMQEGMLRPVLHSSKIERPRTDLDPAAALQVDSAVKNYVPEPKEVRHIHPLQTPMEIIAGGAFYRGSMDGNRDEMPRHKVHVPSFAIDVHPVTNEQFVRFLEVMGGEKDANHHDMVRLKDARIKKSGGKLTIESGYAKHPVVGVTWYGAMAYARWVGKRLPTEAEWEIASRGGDENALYPTGEEIEKSQANFFSSDTTAVMSYATNGYGLYDMAGNVYEWCQDWYGYNYYEVSVQEPENPQGPLQGVYRVLRGGCWKSLKEDLRCSHRHRNNPGTVNGTYGFRCATDVA